MSITKPKVSDTLCLKYLILYVATIGFLRLAPAAIAAPTVVVNEFSSQTSPDWVELYNASNEQINLNNYVLKDNTASGNPKSTFCLLAPHGFVTLDWGTSLNKNGDTIFLKLDDETVDCISFGDGAGGSCPEEFGLALSNPSENQVGARMPDGGTWQLTINSTKDTPNDGSSKPVGAVCPTPTPTPSPTPTLSPTSTPKPATATPVPTNTSTPTLTPTSTLTLTDDNSSPKVLAETDENPQPEVNLEIIDLTATAESEINPSPTSQPEKSGRQTSPVFIISAAGVALMLAGGIPLFWLEFKSKKGIIFK